MEREEGGGGGRGERQGSRLRQRRGGREKRRANVQITRERGGEFLPTFFTSCLKDFTNRNDQTTKTPREDTGTILQQKEKTPKSLALYGTHN